MNIPLTKVSQQINGGMNSEIIDGKKFAQDLLKELRPDVELLRRKKMIPGLAVVLVGDNEESKIYVKHKLRVAEGLGFQVFPVFLPEQTLEKTLLAKIANLNNDARVNGIIVQLPLPEHIDKSKVINAIDPEKDIDGFHPLNAGKLTLEQDALIPCTPMAVIMLLKHFVKQDLSGYKVAIVGRSMIVGKPLINLLINENCTVIALHSKSVKIQEECALADIIISATGQHNLVDENFVKEGAVIIDVGIQRIEGKIVGDINFERIKNKASKITPVPGGVGPVTVACIMYNVIKALCIQKKISIKELMQEAENAERF